MKISSFAALCTAPLALAGTLDMDLRRANLESRNSIVVGESTESTQIEKSNGNNGKKSSSNSQGNNNNQISSITSTSTTEIILIWENAGNNAATQTINPAAASAAPATAATHTVIVGGTTKVYTPDTINAAVGDMVIFEFAQQNHTVTQSAFTSPCVALAGGMDTGFVPNVNSSINPPPQKAMMVNVTTPLWFYCKQVGHCGEGMTFSINPSVNKTQADFQALAIQQNGTGVAAPIVGGSTTAASVASATTVSVASAATSAASSSSGSTGLTTGTGTINSDGSCSCAVVCAAGSIPNVAAQGLNAFGGMAGSIPAANMETQLA